MLEETVEMLEEMNNSKFFATLAKGYRKMFFALRTEGFTIEEAVSICAGQGVGLNIK